MTLTTLNIETALAPYGFPLDMLAEVRSALFSGSESGVEYWCCEGGKQPTHYVYFPNAGRGGVCCGGDTDWTDCDSLDDLADRWDDYEGRWVN